MDIAVYRIQVIVGTGIGRVSKVIDRRLVPGQVKFENRPDKNDIIFKLWAPNEEKAKTIVTNLCTDTWKLDLTKFK